MASDSDKLRQLCQKLHNATDSKKAAELADEIDSLVAIFSTVAFGYIRGELAVAFKHTAYGPVVDHDKHPLLSEEEQRRKNNRFAKEETTA